jgi:hypothetical protein
VENYLLHKKRTCKSKIELVIPKRFHSNHTDHRSGYALIQTAREMGLRKSFGQAEKTELNLLLKLALVPLNLKTLISAAQ